MPAPIFRRAAGIVAGDNVLSVAAPYPSLVAANDIALLWCQSDNDSAINTPAGWTSIGSQYTVGTTFTARLFWRRLAGSETGTVTVTRVASAGVGDLFLCQMTTWGRCVASGTPYEDAGNQTGTSSTATCTPVTTSGIDRRVVQVYGIGSNVTQGSPPAGYTQNWASLSAVGDNGGIVGDSQLVSVAATIPGASRTLGASQPFVSIGLALLPADVPTATTTWGTVKAKAGAAAGTGNIATCDPFTPAANCKLLAFVGARNSVSSFPPTDPAITDDAGLTWVQEDEITFAGAVPGISGWIYSATVGASPVLTTITATTTLAAQTFLMVLEVVGSSGNFDRTARGTSSAGSPSATLPIEPDATSVIVAFCVTAIAENTTPPLSYFSPPSGFIEIHDITSVTGAATNPAAASLAWDTGDQSVLSADSTVVRADTTAFTADATAGAPNSQAVWSSSGLRSVDILLELRSGSESGVGAAGLTIEVILEGEGQKAGRGGGVLSVTPSLGGRGSDTARTFGSGTGELIVEPELGGFGFAPIPPDYGVIFHDTFGASANRILQDHVPTETGDSWLLFETTAGSTEVIAPTVKPPAGITPFLAYPFTMPGKLLGQGWYYSGQNAPEVVGCTRAAGDLPGWNSHCGQDFASNAGFPRTTWEIRSPAAGQARWVGGAQGLVYVVFDVLTPGGRPIWARMNHTDPDLPHIGTSYQTVTKGQFLAWTGMTGTDGIHLHFTIGIGDDPGDPGRNYVDAYDLAEDLIARGIPPTTDRYPQPSVANPSLGPNALWEFGTRAPGSGVSEANFLVEGAGKRMSTQGQLVASQRTFYRALPNPDYPEYDISMTIITPQPAANAPLFFMARWVDTDNYYAAGAYGVSGGMMIIKRVAGVRTILATTTTRNVSIGDELVFQVRDATKSLWLNGELILSTTDNAIAAKGSVGLGTGQAFVTTDRVGGGWRIDNFQVRQLDPPVSGEPRMLATAAGAASATTTAFTPHAGTLLIAATGGRRNAVAPGAPSISSNGNGLTWTPIGTVQQNTVDPLTRATVWAATVPANPVAMTVTTTVANSDSTILVVFEVFEARTSFSNVALKALGGSAEGTIELPFSPAPTSTTFVVDFYAGVVTNVFHEQPMLTLVDETDSRIASQGTVTTGFNVGFDIGRRDPFIYVFAPENNSGTGGLLIAFELLTAAALGSGGWSLGTGVGGRGTKAGTGRGGMALALNFSQTFEALEEIPDLEAQVMMGGFGGRFFVPVPVSVSQTFRGVAARVNYEVFFEMTTTSRWLVTKDVRGISITRDLNTWPGRVEAGTIDMVLDDASGIYSPLVFNVHRQRFRPNLPMSVIATYAHDDLIVRSYYLFRGLVDTIEVNPALDDRTVTVSGTDLWKTLQRRQVSTSLMVDFNAGSMLALTLDAAGIVATQRSIDALPDIVPFAAFHREPLSNILDGFVEGAGYGMFVAPNGTFRVRDRYHDVGGRVIGSYSQVLGFSFSFDADNLVNQISVEAPSWIHIFSRQVVGRLDTMVEVPAGDEVEFYIPYFDPRNQRTGAWAQQGHTPQSPVGSNDWMLNTSSAGSGTDISATTSLRVAFFGEQARVRVFNGAAQAGFLTRLQLRAHPVVEGGDYSAEYSVASSQTTYGLRSATVRSPFLTTPDQLERRALDVLDLWKSPTPRVRLTTVDEFPSMLQLDLGDIVQLDNAHAGIVREQYTVYSIMHQLRADGVGIQHQIQLDLREARAGVEFSGFVLDTSQLDVDRLSR